MVIQSWTSVYHDWHLIPRLGRCVVKTNKLVPNNQAYFFFLNSIHSVTWVAWANTKPGTRQATMCIEKPAHSLREHICIFRNSSELFLQTLSTDHRGSSLYFQRLRVASFFICAWGELVMAGEWAEKHTHFLWSLSPGGEDQLPSTWYSSVFLRPHLKICQGCWNATKCNWVVLLPCRPREQ